MEIFQSYNQDPTIHAIERVTETMGGTPGITAPVGAVHEAPWAMLGLDVPPDIYDLLTHSLVDAGMSGGATDKFRITGHPDLLARHVKGASLDGVIHATRAAQALGLPITPTAVVEHDGKPYQITKVVQGQCLEDLPAGASPELLRVIDETWQRLCEAVATALKTGEEWPTDTEALHQHMLGTLPGDTVPRVWMVDLPASTMDLGIPSYYADELFYLLRSLYDIEQKFDAKMVQTRQALAAAIELCPDTVLDGDGPRNAARYCLKNDIDLYTVVEDEDDFIQSMRTRQS